MRMQMRIEIQWVFTKAWYVTESIEKMDMEQPLLAFEIV